MSFRYNIGVSAQDYSSLTKYSYSKDRNDFFVLCIEDVVICVALGVPSFVFSNTATFSWC